MIGELRNSERLRIQATATAGCCVAASSAAELPFEFHRQSRTAAWEGQGLGVGGDRGGWVGGLVVVVDVGQRVLSLEGRVGGKLAGKGRGREEKYMYTSCLLVSAT